MFKSGDRVSCIDASGTTFLEEGQEYIVKSVEYGGTHVSLNTSDRYSGKDSTYSVKRFEIVS